MSPSSWNSMLKDEACPAPIRDGSAAFDRVVSSCRTSPVESHTTSSPSRRPSLFGSETSAGDAPPSPANPCWALDTAAIMTPRAQNSMPTATSMLAAAAAAAPPAAPMTFGPFGAYTWPRVATPAAVSGIWSRGEPSTPRLQV
ncbi:hypothetical protein PLESTB_001255700 [Pleodorina starrii]|uniref:Uncharacterized protein n=1 Tax=Pleodorina starrii TaxID=330485 RepID=A0A9W6F639_9CHLO|nr:hypothetical protein PLESTM_000204300 [Pleodorina starrii]GLC57704.1 hypothetical protein PLESTB_001255700 [Pleodorina starrii]GLC63374.1 hypothetical protein PLESTF_000029500 [Pleodorina starrii]